MTEFTQEVMGREKNLSTSSVKKSDIWKQCTVDAYFLCFKSKIEKNGKLEGVMFSLSCPE